MTADAHGNFSGNHLVIFGAGYVGSAMARQAIGRGLRVTALTRNEEKAEALRALGATPVIADLAGNAWHEKIPGGAEFVLNCVSSGGGGVMGAERSYLRGMESVLAWARGSGGVGTLIYTSSTSVYPQGGGTSVDEGEATDGNGERAKILVATEKLLANEDLGTVEEMSGPRISDARWTHTLQRYFILRLAGIYGPGRHHLLEQVRAGEVAGRGDYHLNLVHLEDICAAIWAAFGAPSEIKNKIFNVADDGAATKSEITTWLAAQLRVAPPRFTLEPAGGRRAITPDRLIVNTRLKKNLGWQPRYPSFREGYSAILSA